LELIFNFSTKIRTFLFFFGLLIPIGTFSYFLVIPFFQFKLQLKEEKYLRVASIIGNYFPNINDKLLNSLQLANSVDLKSIYSTSLIDAVIDETEKETVNINFEEAVDSKKLKFAFYLFSICLFSSVLIFTFVPNLTYALERIYNYSINYEPPPRFSFEVYPGNSKITKGDNLKVQAKISGAEINKAELHFAEEGLEVFESNVIESDSLGKFNYTFISPQRSFYYFFSAEEVKSEKYFVEVVNRPIIKSLQVKVIPPVYSKLPVQDYEDNGDINALYGSAITINLTANKNLSEAKIIFSDTSQIKFDVQNHKAITKFIARKNLTYRIFIFDEDKNENLNPVEYQIKVSNDNPPFIALVKPENKNINLTDDMRVSTLVKIKDDFGFSNLTLNYKLSYSRYEQPKEEYEK
ncbi:MAG: hypothetical protein N3A61_04715, partial [Ignavibacteria bacterium]|nr:hypothetical protein [Ignavibacteria bacterium]